MVRKMEAEEWWKPDKFEVIDSLSNAVLDDLRETLKFSNQLRALYSKAKNRLVKRNLIQIPLVVQPNPTGGVEIMVIGDVVSWPEGTAEKILKGELRAATATFRVEKKRRREKTNKDLRFRRHANMQISIQQADMQGERPLMEDRYVIHLFNDIAVFGVFDGHGGFGAADFVSNALIPALRTEFRRAVVQGQVFSFTESNPQPPDAIETETVRLMRQSLAEAIAAVEFQALDHLHRNNDFSGTTLCACLCTRSTLIVANMGDSKVYVSRNGVPKQVTGRDHSASNNSTEKARIEQEGGYVSKEGYLGGLVQVSRALGDIDPATSKKVVGLSAVPEMIEFPLDKDKDEFVLVACDGLWEVMSGQGAINHIRMTLKNTKGDLLKAAEGLVAKAMELKTSDNVTVVIAFLPVAERIWTSQPSSSPPPGGGDDENRPRFFRKTPTVVAC